MEDPAVNSQNMDTKMDALNGHTDAEPKIFHSEILKPRSDIDASKLEDGPNLSHFLKGACRLPGGEGSAAS